MEQNNYEQPQCTVVEVETEAIMAASQIPNPFTGNSQDDWSRPRF